MSIESAQAMVAALDGWVRPAPPAAPPAAPPTSGVRGPAFAQALRTATAAGAKPTAATPATTRPHLRGDLDARPELLDRLERLGASLGQTLQVTSGGRTHAEQQALWDVRGSNPFPVARPGTSRHETGRAADVSIGGRPVQEVVPAAVLRRFGLVGLAGDAVHVELAS